MEGAPDSAVGGSAPAGTSQPGQQIHLATDPRAAVFLPGLAAPTLATGPPRADDALGYQVSGAGPFPGSSGAAHPLPYSTDPNTAAAILAAAQTAVAAGPKAEPGAAAPSQLGPLTAQPPAAAPSRAVADGSGVAAAAAPSTQTDPEAIAAALAARIAACGATVIFEKALTASDVSGGGRVVVPKSVAEQYFPRLEVPSGVTISATDLDGRTYTFKWRFWVNNSSRMYLLEGAGELHRNYGLEVGDVMVFAQKPDGSLVVAGRVAIKSDLAKKPPLKRPAAATAGSHPGGAARGGREARGGRGPVQRIAPAAAPAGPSDPAAGGPGGPAAGAAATAGGSGRQHAGLPGGGVAGGPGYEGGGGAGRGRKRKTVTPLPGPGTDPRVHGRGEEDVSLAVLDMEAPSDGVFRALVMQHVAPVALGVALARNNRWTATLDVAGELYQAFFDTRDDAVEALMAAGASP